MLQSLPDKQKLFNKIFVGINYQPQKNKPPLIVSGDFLNLILKQIQCKSNKLSKKSQKELLIEILQLFKNNQVNSLHIYDYDKKRQQSLLQMLITTILQLVYDQTDIYLFSTYLDFLTSFYLVKLKNITTITQMISKAFYQEKFNPQIFKFAIKVLNNYFGIKKGLQNSPPSFFYLYGESNFGIKSLISNNGKTKNELSAMIVFKLLSKNDLLKKEKSSSNLLNIKSSKEQINIFIDETIVVQNKSLSKIIKLQKANLEEHKWYRLVVNFTSSNTKIYLNSQSYQFQSLMAKQTERQVSVIHFGNKFSGFMSSLLLSSSILEMQKFSYQQFPFGVQNWEILRILRQRNHKFVQKLITTSLPFCLLQVRYKSYCFDISQKAHSQIGQNIITYNDDSFQSGSQYLGKPQIILPLFYLARFYKKQTYPNLLTDLLQLIQTYIIKYNTTNTALNNFSLKKQISHQDQYVNSEILDQQFFIILGNHISLLTSFLNQQVLVLMNKIQAKLNDDQKVYWLKHVMWNISIFQLYDAKIVKQYFLILIKKYQNHKSISLKALGLHQLLYWTVKHFQHKSRINDKSIQSYNCCLQHYVNQSILANDFDIEQGLKLQQYNYKQHYLWIQTIASIILEYMLIDDINQAGQILKSLLRFFMHKFSSCFYLMILGILKKQILKFKNDATFIKALSTKCQIGLFLSFLSQKTINCDLVTQIIYFSLFAYQYQKTEQRLQIIQFIIQLILRLKQLINCKSPISSSIKKIRKRSVDYALIQNRQNLQVQKIKGLCSKRLQKIQNWYPFLIIIKNFLIGVVSDIECHSLSYNFTNQDAFVLMRTYFQVGSQQNKQILLKQVYKVMNLNKTNKSFLVKSYNFNQLMLTNLLKHKMQIKQDEINLDQISNIMFKIFVELLIHVFKQNLNFNQYYYLLMTVSQQSKIGNLNQLVVQLLLVSFQKYILQQIITLDQLIYVYLLLQYQISVKIKQSSEGLSQFLNFAKRLKILCMLKIIDKTKQFYIQDLQSIKKAFINQNFQLSTSKQINQSIGIIYTNIQRKVPKCMRKASNLSNETENSTETQKLKQKQDQIQRNINCVLFDQKINTLKQGSQQFWFDGLISKLTSNIKMYLKNSDKPKQKLLQQLSNTYLNQNQKKSTFIFQIFINSLIQQIELLEQDNANQQQKVSHPQSINKNHLLKVLADIFCLYLIVSVSKGNIFQNSKLLRMLLFLISGHLAQNLNSKQKNQQTLKTYTKIWKSIICATIHNYGQIKNQKKQFDNSNINLQEFLQTINGYQDLSKYVQSNQINPVLVQTLQFFILDSDGRQLITVQDWHRLIKSQQDEQLFEKQLQSIIINDKFIQVITLNHQTIKIMKICNQANFDTLNKKFKKAANTIKKRSSGELLKKQNSLKINKDHLFDKENIIQQEVRLRYLHNEECRLRQFHSKWKKIWKKMRIFNEPYGLYMAMRNNASNFQLSQSKGQFKNFMFKMSKYTSNSLIQPILQAKVIEPWHVSKYKYFQQKNQMYSLVDMMRPDQHLIKKSHLTQNFNYKLTNIWNLMLWKTPKEEKKSFQYHVIWIKGSIKARGRILINKYQQIQFWYQSIKQGDSHLSFQNFSLEFNKQTYKIWPLVSIKKIWKKRYLMKYDAIELELTNSKCILLYFKDKNEKDFLAEIAKIREDKIFHFGNKIKLNKISIFQNNWYQEEPQQRITQMWRNNKISNLHYLMYLNKVASRGIYDLSQYPVVPWMAHMTTQKQPKIRDLTKTMGSLGSEQRKNLLLDKYKAKDPFNPVPPFHFGTHYSSPGVVFNFLIRLAPFTQYCKHLQGGKFDIPDRLFSSLINSWKSAFNEVSDVRQLTPQFYYLPQFLLNLQKHNFGCTQNGQNINNVQLPPWAAENPYFFTIQFRQILQSQIASSSINEWIDLIFGYKQRGQQAANSFNVYYYLTYEQYSNLDDEDDQVHKKSCQAQIVHFGQIPPQLFIKAHPKRQKNEKSFLELNISQKYLLMNKMSQKQKIFGIRVKKQLKELLMITKNSIEHYSLLKNPICLTKTFKVNFQKSQSEIFYLLSKEASKVVFFNNHDYFIMYGYINNQFRVYNSLTGKIQKFQVVQSLITTIFISEAEDLVLVGCQNGMLHIFQLQYQPAKMYWQRVHCEMFPFAINHISQNDGFFTFSYGVYVSIYKITRAIYYLCARQKTIKAEVKLLRSYKNSLKLRQSYIVTSPLYGIVMIDNAHIKVYSINGQFLKSNNCNIKRAFMIKDNELNDYLYYFEQQRVVLLSLPDLRCVSELPIQETYTLWKNGFITLNAICEIGWQS